MGRTRPESIVDVDDRRQIRPAPPDLPLTAPATPLTVEWRKSGPFRHIERRVGSAVETAIAGANLKFQAFFGQAWNQSKVTVHFKLDSNRLELWLTELDNAGKVTDIEERSDGLLMFVSLAAFVSSQRLAIPPILLIDEAETHLHFDSQADLVGVLLKQVEATQVFYTTRSPGCLPADLGTGYVWSSGVSRTRASATFTTTSGRTRHRGSRRCFMPWARLRLPPPVAASRC